MNLLHLVRDAAVRLAAERPLKPYLDSLPRVVLIRPDHFGDLLMLAPAVNWIRQHNIEFELILMTGPWNLAAAEHLDLFDQVVAFPFPGFTRTTTARSGALDAYRSIWDAAAIMRELRPRATVLLRDDHWWGAWATREAGVPLRFGYRHPQLVPFLTHPLPPRSVHYVEQNMELIASALAALGTEVPLADEPRHTLPMRWPVDEAAAARVAELRKSMGIGDRFFVVHPGTGAEVKRWPARRWERAIEHLQDDTGMQAVLTGAGDEQSITREISWQVDGPVIDLTGQTGIPELSELYRNSALVMGVDSGPLHLATAVGTPSVHLYGPSDRRRYGPWGDPRRHRTVTAEMQCPRCGELSADRVIGCGCMMAISVDDVVESALEVLEYATSTDHRD